MQGNANDNFWTGAPQQGQPQQPNQPAQVPGYQPQQPAQQPGGAPFGTGYGQPMQGQPQPQPAPNIGGAVAAFQQQGAPANLDALGDLVGGAEPTKQGVYLVEGMYPLLQINACKIQVSRKSGGQLFIAELLILESQVPSHPKGLEVSWTANLTHHQPAAGNVRQFIATASNSPVDAIGKDHFSAAVGPNNPLSGRLIGCQCTNITTQKGNPFTKHIWTAVPEDLQRQAMDIRRQVLGR